MKVIVPFAEGFEEIEAVTIVDVLRRAEIDVTTVYLDENPVTGSHNISVMADKKIGDIDPVNFGCIILPGGMPGSENLRKNERNKRTSATLEPETARRCSVPLSRKYL